MDDYFCTLSLPTSIYIRLETETFENTCFPTKPILYEIISKNIPRIERGMSDSLVQIYYYNHRQTIFCPIYVQYAPQIRNLPQNISNILLPFEIKTLLSHLSPPVQFSAPKQSILESLDVCQTPLHTKIPSQLIPQCNKSKCQMNGSYSHCTIMWGEKPFVCSCLRCTLWSMFINITAKLDLTASLALLWKGLHIDVIVR